MFGTKRRNENAQVRKEDYEGSLGTSREQPGLFARASADVLAKRKMVSVSDRFVAAANKESPPALFGGFGAQQNPFASVVLKPAEAPKPPRPATSGATDKITRCNAAFAAWLRRQQTRAPSVPWTDGVRDYLRYVEPLIAQQRREGTASGFPPAAPVAPAVKPAAEEDDDDALPVEPKAELIRADDGDETPLFECRCAIRRLDRDEDGVAWRDLGKGLLRLMKHKDTGAKRVVVRNDVGKVVLNFAVVDTMKFHQDAKGGLKFTAVVDNGPHNYLLRTKPPLEPRHLAPATVIADS